MADNTPSIQEITGGNIDPQVATGEPAVVYDNSPLLNILNQNAQFKAANDWRKYNQFLTDYETRLKNQQEIADKEVADSDRDWLKKESVSLFKDALSDPYKIYSPEFNSKLSNLRANATSSKQARDFAEKNAQWIAIHPEFNTDENKTKINDFINVQTVEKGGRKFFTLDAPDVFDYMGYVGNLKDDPSVKETIDASSLSPDNQFFTERQDTKYKRDPFLRLVDYSYDANPKVRKYAESQFKELPDNLKSQFKDAKGYWNALGAKSFGSDKDILNQGKPNIQVNQNYLEAEKLAQKERESKRDDATRRYIASLGKEKGKTPQQVIDEMGNAFDSFPSWKGQSGAYNDEATGMYYNKDGMPLTGEIRLSKKEIPDGVINLIQQGNEKFSPSEAATIKIKDGRIEEVQFDGKPTITRNNILNYQVNEVSKFTEKGNPYLPYYGAKGGRQNIKPKESKTKIISKRKASDGNYYYKGDNGRIYSDPEGTVDVTEQFK